MQIDQTYTVTFKNRHKFRSLTSSIHRQKVVREFLVRHSIEDIGHYKLSLVSRHKGSPCTRTDKFFYQEESEAIENYISVGKYEIWVYACLNYTCSIKKVHIEIKNTNLCVIYSSPYIEEAETLIHMMLRY